MFRVVKIVWWDNLIFIFLDFDGIDDVIENLIGCLFCYNDVVFFLVIDLILEEILVDVKFVVLNGDL